MLCKHWCDDVFFRRITLCRQRSFVLTFFGELKIVVFLLHAMSNSIHFAAFLNLSQISLHVYERLPLLAVVPCFLFTDAFGFVVEKSSNKSSAIFSFNRRAAFSSRSRAVSNCANVS